MTGPAAPGPTSPSRLERLAPWVFCVSLFLLATGPVLFNPRLQLYYRDTGRLYYPVRKYIADRLSRGELPLWDPWSEAGVSLLGQITPALLHPFTLLYLVLPFDFAFKLHHLLPLPLAGVGAFLLARQLSASRPAAVVAGIAYGGCGFLVSMAASNLPYVVGPATVPWAVWAFLRFLERPAPLRLLFAAALLGSCVLAGEPQSALFGGLIGGLWALARGLLGADHAGARERLARSLRGAGFVALWGLCSLCLAAPAVLPALPRIEASTRMKALNSDERENFYVSPLRLPGYALTMAFDDYVDEAYVLDGYRHAFYAEYFSVGDRTSFSDSLHLGLPVLFLALFSAWRGRRGRFLLIAGLTALLASCGVGLGVWDALACVVPGFGFFRFAEKLAAPASLLFSLGAALGLDAALQARWKTMIVVGLALAAAIGLVLLRGVLASERTALEAALVTAGRLHYPEAAQAFAAALQESVLLAAGLMAVLGLFLAVGMVPSRLRALTPWLAAAAIAASTLSFTSGMLFSAGIDLLHAPPKLARQLLAEEGPSAGRWRFNADSNGTGSRRLVSGDARFVSVAGILSALYPQFDGLFGIEGVVSYFSLPDLVYERIRAASVRRADQLLGVQVVSLGPGTASLAEARRAGFFPTSEGYLVRKNAARPRAFLADHIDWAGSVDQQVELFASPSFDLTHQAIVDRADEPRLAGLGLDGHDTTEPGRVESSRPSPESIRVLVTTTHPQLLVVAEHFDAGWSARVDSLAAPVVRVDGAVLGVPVAAGRHTVELRFWPTGLSPGILLAALCCLGAIAAHRFERRVPSLR